jgi:hypothetical protein
MIVTTMGLNMHHRLLDIRLYEETTSDSTRIRTATKRAYLIIVSAPREDDIDKRHRMPWLDACRD